MGNLKLKHSKLIKGITNYVCTVIYYIIVNNKNKNIFCYLLQMVTNFVFKIK